MIWQCHIYKLNSCMIICNRSSSTIVTWNGPSAQNWEHRFLGQSAWYRLSHKYGSARPLSQSRRNHLRKDIDVGINLHVVRHGGPRRVGTDIVQITVKSVGQFSKSSYHSEAKQRTRKKYLGNRVQVVPEKVIINGNPHLVPGPCFWEGTMSSQNRAVLQHVLHVLW